MNNFKKILPFLVPYKKYAFLNIFFNILYAFFGTLSFVSLAPMIQVLFGESKKITTEPVWTSIWELKKYSENYLNYYITNTTIENGVGYTLSVMVVFIILVFILKNLSDYFALYFINFLRNGILRDLRNAMYKKTIELPLAFFSEKRKGDTIARIAGDVNEVQSSMLSILELIKYKAK